MELNTALIQGLQNIMPELQKLLGEIFEAEEDIYIKKKVAKVIGIVDVITAAVNNDTKKIDSLIKEARIEIGKQPLKLVT